MKKHFCLALVLCILFGGIALAEDKIDIRKSSEKAFDQLASNCITALNQIVQDKNNGIKNSNLAKFKISEVPTQTQTQTTTTTTKIDGQTSSNTSTVNSTIDSKIGIKVWFELADGTLVNPLKKNWKPKEQFYIHIESAVPIYVSLHQNFAKKESDSNKKDSDSVQVYPNEKFPDSFKVVQAKQSVKLPVLFELDDNNLDEIMSMVVVRADWSGIQSGLDSVAVNSVVASTGNTNSNSTAANNSSTSTSTTASATSSTSSSQNNLVAQVSNISRAEVTSRINNRGAGTMKCINDSVFDKDELTETRTEKNIGNSDRQEIQNITKAVNSENSNAKFCIIGAEVSTSSKPDEVCFYMFANAHFGQWQLTIKK